MTNPLNHQRHEPLVVLITGCSSGIGLDTATTLQQRGYRVFATARHPDDVSKLIERGLESIQLDLNDSHSIRAAVQYVLKQSDGKIYALFNNGAYGQPGAVEDLTRDTLRKQFETNLFGWLELTNLVIPVMREQGCGRIIQNSSVLGLVSLKFRGAYNASKYALEGLSDTMRQELNGSGIHVSLIEPGPIESQFRANAARALYENIDIDNSVFKTAYQKTTERLEKQGPAVPFTLPASAVTKKVIHALESRRPRPRYYVTFPTWLFGIARRVLSTRMLDRLLGKI